MSKLKQGLKFLSISILLTTHFHKGCLLDSYPDYISIPCCLVRNCHQDKNFILIKGQCFITFCYIGTIYVALDDFNVFEQMSDVDLHTRINSYIAIKLHLTTLHIQIQGKDIQAMM